MLIKEKLRKTKGILKEYILKHGANDDNSISDIKYNDVIQFQKYIFHNAVYLYHALQHYFIANTTLIIYNIIMKPTKKVFFGLGFLTTMIIYFAMTSSNPSV
ncbi:hypothetical protein RCL_jg12775.t1 [Rhizophagus clarus]|uniref:Uncharacterized protein n=1 Tax=Rhizophagus clarus TaxID=94130 RepID=A0A8H3KVH0_9GLOM|nr:hypothetical protein RCL_jg12775.t1 [Rhizophagus clarus]